MIEKRRIGIGRRKSSVSDEEASEGGDERGWTRQVKTKGASPPNRTGGEEGAATGTAMYNGIKERIKTNEERELKNWETRVRTIKPLSSEYLYFIIEQTLPRFVSGLLQKILITRPDSVIDKGRTAQIVLQNRIRQKALRRFGCTIVERPQEHSFGDRDWLRDLRHTRDEGLHAE